MTHELHRGRPVPRPRVLRRHVAHGRMTAVVEVQAVPSLPPPQQNPRWSGAAPPQAKLPCPAPLQVGVATSGDLGQGDVTSSGFPGKFTFLPFLFMTSPSFFYQKQSQGGRWGGHPGTVQMKPPAKGRAAAWQGLGPRRMTPWSTGPDGHCPGLSLLKMPHGEGG